MMEMRSGSVTSRSPLTSQPATQRAVRRGLCRSEDGKVYSVVIVGSPNVNPGYKLVGNSRYPQIAQDYEHTFRVLKSLPCDVFLGAHGAYYGMTAKFARVGKDGANPFVDPEGYKAYVADREQAFRTALARQTAGGQ